MNAVLLILCGTLKCNPNVIIEQLSSRAAVFDWTAEQLLENEKQKSSPKNYIWKSIPFIPGELIISEQPEQIHTID